MTFILLSISLFNLYSFISTYNKLLFKFTSKVRKVEWILNMMAHTHKKKLDLGKQYWYFKAKYFQAGLKSSTKYLHLLASDPNRTASCFLRKALL